MTFRARSTSANRTCPCSSRSTSSQSSELGRIELVDESLGQYRDAEVAPHRPALDDRAFDDVADRGKRHVGGGTFLRDDRERGPGSLADTKRQMSGFASHGDDDVPAPRGPGVFHQVSHHLDSDVAGGLEAERGHVRWEWQVVVDCLRYVDAADGAVGVFAHVARGERRIVAANRHQIGDARLLEGLDHGPCGLGRGGRVLARGPEDRSPEQVHARDVIDREWPKLRRIAADEVSEAILDPDDLEALVERLYRRGRNHGVDARGRSAADKNAEAARG